MTIYSPGRIFFFPGNLEASEKFSISHMKFASRIRCLLSMQGSTPELQDSTLTETGLFFFF